MSDHKHLPIQDQSAGCCSPAGPAGSSDDLASCPVMPGSLVSKRAAEAAGLFRDHNGTRYWLCCAGCGPRFDADPERYISV